MALRIGGEDRGPRAMTGRQPLRTCHNGLRRGRELRVWWSGDPEHPHDVRRSIDLDACPLGPVGLACRGAIGGVRHGEHHRDGHLRGDDPAVHERRDGDVRAVGHVARRPVSLPRGWIRRRRRGGGSGRSSSGSIVSLVQGTP